MALTPLEEQEQCEREGLPQHLCWPPGEPVRPRPHRLCCGSAQRPPGTRSMMGELPHSLPGHNFLNPRLLLLPEK